jgi:hypothetical protein
MRQSEHMPSLSASLPRPLRKPLSAAVGLAVSTVDRAKSGARHIPERVAALPITVASTALQVALRARQQYSDLAERGDEVLHLDRATGAGEDGVAAPTPLRTPSKFDAVDE